MRARVLEIINNQKSWPHYEFGKKILCLSDVEDI